MIEVLTNNHYDKIMDAFDSARKKIAIISPFLSMPMAKKLCKIVEDHQLECIFITRLYLEDIFAKANSIDALDLMLKSGIKVYALKGLHTKLYLFDDNIGILGSANFTSGGFVSNFELSLMATNEPEILTQLHQYFYDLVSQLDKVTESTLTEDILVDVRKKYQHLLDNKKTAKVQTTSMYMYGAELRKKKISNDAILKEVTSAKNMPDIIQDIFQPKTEEITFDHTIWLKFDGEGNNRINPFGPFPMVQVNLNGKKIYIQNYPYKVHSIKDGDEIYLAAITTDASGKNQPVIVGRGTLCGFAAENTVPSTWIAEYDWMDRYPYYCVTKCIRLLNTNVANGVPLSAVWDALGSDTYLSSFGRNETYIEVSHKHYQKAHMRLSGNAKEYIDSRLSELEEKYGFVEYTSEL